MKAWHQLVITKELSWIFSLLFLFTSLLPFLKPKGLNRTNSQARENVASRGSATSSKVWALLYILLVRGRVGTWQFGLQAPNSSCCNRYKKQKQYQLSDCFCRLCSIVGYRAILLATSCVLLRPYQLGSAGSVLQVCTAWRDATARVGWSPGFRTKLLKRWVETHICKRFLNVLKTGTWTFEVLRVFCLFLGSSPGF